MARPMPCVDAVTTATFPSRRRHLTSIAAVLSLAARSLAAVLCCPDGRKEARVVGERRGDGSKASRAAWREYPLGPGVLRWFVWTLQRGPAS
jgi:hypothetical protein